MPGLREQARDDLKFTVGDRETGFGWDITVTRPDGDTLDLVALQSDIAETIDTETGIAILGRTAHVAVQIQDFLDATWEVPVVITDPEVRPWKVDTTDVNGRAHSFKISEVRQDRAIGLVLCFLESYT